MSADGKNDKKVLIRLRDIRRSKGMSLNALADEVMEVIALIENFVIIDNSVEVDMESKARSDIKRELKVLTDGS